jgi:hypothetical protein
MSKAIDLAVKLIEFSNAVDAFLLADNIVSILICQHEMNHRALKVVDSADTAEELELVAAVFLRNIAKIDEAKKALLK